MRGIRSLAGKRRRLRRCKRDGGTVQRSPSRFVFAADLIMVRPLSEYDLADWRRLRPLLHALKTTRYRLVAARYVRRAAVGPGLPTLARSLTGKRVLTTIAFGDAEVVGWQIQLVRRHVPSTVHVIADNSRDEAAAAQIAAVCGAFDTPYLRLPRNPWRQSSRSHGAALNWVWRNLIRPAAPEAFGFLDHDLFPTAPDDPFAALSKQDCFGLVRTAGPRWYLWPGYCVFRFDRVRDLPLDFGQDWFNGLDTGGGNWRSLYRRLARTELQEAHTTFAPYEPGVDVADAPLQWVGSWLHEVGTMKRPELRGDRREVLRAILAPHLAAIQGAPCVAN
jgi:hypothetical protein